MRLPDNLSHLSSCLHFLVVANDNPMTPALAHKSATLPHMGHTFVTYEAMNQKPEQKQQTSNIQVGFLSRNIR